MGEEKSPLLALPILTLKQGDDTRTVNTHHPAPKEKSRKTQSNEG